MKSSRCGFSMIDVVCVMISTAAIVGLMWPRTATSGAGTNAAAERIRRVPQVRIVNSSDGIPRAEYDAEAIASICAAEGLPILPEMRRADPVSAGILLDALSGWVDRREPRALGDVGRVAVALAMEEHALPWFLAAIEIDSANAARWRYFAGICCQRLGDDVAARTLLEQARADGAPAAITSARLGAIALDQGDLERAAREYEASRAANPNDSIAYFGAAQVALARGDAAAALAMIDAALKARPNDTRAARLRVRTLALLGRVDESAKASAYAARLPEYFGWLPFDPLLREAHDFADTINSSRTNFMRAIGRQDWSAAIALGENLIVRQPRDGTIVSTLAAAYLGAGRNADAASAAERASVLAPRDPGVLQTVAEIALKQSRLDDCLRACDGILSVEKTSVRALDLKARAVFMKGDQSQGIAIMLQAIALRPDDSSLRLGLAAMYHNARKVADARTVLEEILRREPNNRAAATQLMQLQQSR